MRGGHNSRNADAMGGHAAHMAGNKLPIKPHRTTSRACCVDTKAARLHLEEIGVKLTRLTKKQADYLGVPVEGPYKPGHCRY